MYRRARSQMLVVAQAAASAWGCEPTHAAAPPAPPLVQGSGAEQGGA